LIKKEAGENGEMNHVDGIPLVFLQVFGEASCMTELENLKECHYKMSELSRGQQHYSESVVII